MRFPKELTTVTTLSKIVALIMFITMPIIGFFLGRNYQMIFDMKNTIQNTIPVIPKICPMDALLCPDGSSVSRTGANCDFAPCPTIAPLNQKRPLVSPAPSTYACPSSSYVDCMPGPGPVKSQCATAYLQWAKTNCPNFKGAAY